METPIEATRLEGLVSRAEQISNKISVQVAILDERLNGSGKCDDAKENYEHNSLFARLERALVTLDNANIDITHILEKDI